jgi:hypothetical protein
MPKSKHRKNQKQKSRERTRRINTQRENFSKKMNELLMRQIEEVRSKSSGETENQSTQDAGYIQPAQEL